MKEPNNNRPRVHVVFGQSVKSVFGQSPSPPSRQTGGQPQTPITPLSGADVQQHIHLSNMAPGRLQRAQSTPIVNTRQGSFATRVFNATMHSPYFRPHSPQVTTRSMLVRRRTSDASESSRRSRLRQDSATSATSITTDYEGEIPDGVHVVEEKNLMSVWTAGFSIINLFLGLGLLSFPYALAQGSLTSLIALGLICVAMSYTGKLIVRCFKMVPMEERTYPQVGYRAMSRLFYKAGSTSNEERQTLKSNTKAIKSKWGSFGYGFVTFGILLEFIGAMCMSTIFIWDNVGYLVPTLESWELILICTVIILPTCWMLNFSELSFNSFLGCVCKIVTVIVIVMTFFINMSVTKTTKYDTYPTSPTRFSVSVGIFILSYAGHACLPSIYTSMKEPERFEKTLDICFVIMFLTYSGMALFGYLQFGAATQVIITGNLVQYDQGYQMIISKILIALVIASCYFQVSPILSVVAEIPEAYYNVTVPWKQRIFRTVLYFILVVLSWILLPHLAILEAATGSLCTMITSVICPPLFYYGLYSKSVSKTETVVLFTYIVFGVVFGIYLLYNDIISVVSGEQ